MTRGFRRLAVASVLAALVLITVGGLVRASGSGLGCPDWPRCHGRLLPPLDPHAIIEYSHRLAASVTGILVLALAIVAWVRYRSSPSIFWPSFGALIVVIFQGGLGRLVVREELKAHLVALHFGTSLVLLGLLVLVAVNAALGRRGRLGPLARLGVAAAAGSFSVALVGAVVVQWKASLAFADWPLMAGSVFPRDFASTPLIHYVHRLGALALGVLIVVMAIRAMRPPRDRVLVALAHTSLGLWIAQVLAGGLNVLTRLAPAAMVTHVSLGAMLWAATLAFAVAAYRRTAAAEPAPAAQPVAGVAATLKAYFALTKPRVIELLLITTVPAMIAAAGGWPPAGLVLATLVGGAMAAGGANAINCYLDRDIDERMERTSNRPLPTHQVEAVKALRFGIVLSVVALVWLTLTVNLLAASLAVSAILFYVFVYTIWLKRSTPSNIVIGGAAGAVPVLVGWAAVRGQVEIPALVMFAIVFYWTPPHFWALALRYSDDYAAAGVPMLPVARGVPETTRHIVLYSVVLVGVSLLLYPAARLGNLYLIAAVVLGGLFVAEALRLRRRPDLRRAMSLFRLSITYLTLLFAVVAIDRLVGGHGSAWTYGAALGAGAVLFFVFEAAILLAVLRQRAGATRSRLAEVTWTAIPTIVSALMFLSSWRTLG
ncbi:MAG: heme o synthase [Actinomycetota bacterium]